jgi:GH25 family lysozyme M1 (1,4-beta-N-acetylmuramidase)
VSGWLTADGQLGYFDPANDGAAPQGWFAHPNGKTYYFWWGGKGAFATGAQEIGGKAYGFNGQGHKVEGWLTADGQLRYFDPANDGVAPQGWFAHPNGNKYYFWWGGKGAFAIGLCSINDVEYYFNDDGHLMANHKTVVAGREVTTDESGAVISKIPVGVMRGIDVSEWQGSINWAAVKASGVSFAVIRAGWTDWKDRTGEGMGAYFHQDAYFVQNVRAAQAQGIAVGAYIYIYSRNISEQQWALTNFNNYARSYGLAFDLPVFLDVEDSQYYLPSTDALGGYAYRTYMLQDGLNQLRSMGYRPGMYTFLNWANTKFNTYALINEGNTFWLASWYSNNAELDPNTAAWNGGYPGIWQYRSTGSVPGIKGNVDMNYLYPYNVQW